MEVAERTDARKEKRGRAEALALAKSVDTVIVGKGKQVVTFDMRDPPDDDTLAAHLLGRETSPTQAVARAERLVRLQEALNALDPLDREVLSLRHFEELSHAEAARVLDIGEAAAAKRYVRALKMLKDVLSAL